MKALGFFYCWNDDGKLDSYFGRVAESFGEIGVELSIILGNQLIVQNTMDTWLPLVSERKILAYIEREKPDFIFTVNNAGMTSWLQERIRIPVIKWLVDDLPHLFMHDGSANTESLIKPNDFVVCYSSTLAQQISSLYPSNRERIFFVPHGTAKTKTAGLPVKDQYPISFVGSSLDTRPLSYIMGLARKLKTGRKVMLALGKLSADYLTTEDELISDADIKVTLYEAKIDKFMFKRILSDVLTTQLRMTMLNAVSDLGLYLFGNNHWFDSLCMTQNLVKCFQFDSKVSNYRELESVYDKSRLAINIPNVQNCAGLATRVFDTMASEALLITQHHADSDLYRLFGQHCPVPTYKDENELRNLCDYYLTHETERRKIVEACQALITTEFTITSRLAEMLRTAGITPVPAAETATYRILKTSRFYGLPRTFKNLKQWIRQLIVRGIRRLVWDLKAIFNMIFKPVGAN